MFWVCEVSREEVALRAVVAMNECSLLGGSFSG